MDDLEFRRRAYAEPDSEDADFLQKKNASEENTRLVDELKQFDEKLSEVLHVEPPEGLAERIKLNQTLGLHVQNKKKYRLLWSMAASVLIVCSVVFSFMQFTSQPDLPGQLLTHVYDELHHLDDDHGYSIDHTNLVLASHGVRLVSDIGHVKYVSECEIDDQSGVHMVLQGEHGAVTVMMMPDRHVGHVMPIVDSRFQGSIAPVARGSLAIIAEKGEPIDDLRRSLNSSLQWKF